jgi:hypothetical protein
MDVGGHNDSSHKKAVRNAAQAVERLMGDWPARTAVTVTSRIGHLFYSGKGLEGSLSGDGESGGRR